MAVKALLAVSAPACVASAVLAPGTLQAEEAAPQSENDAEHLRSLISATERLVRPWRGLAYSEADVAEVRRLALEDPANAAAVKAILSKATEWMARSDEAIAALVPKEGEPFAAGLAGDPKTGKTWPRFGGGGLCSLDRPGEIRSLETGDVYGTQKPGEEYYDDGNGWTRKSDGRVFYFKGQWNSYVVDRFHEAIDYLSLAYLLTGDEKMAAKALLIFDRLATLRAHSPDYKCMIDSVRMADQRVGFFRYQGNIANQRVINSALALDLLGNSTAAREPSSFGGKMTMRDNIEKHYFDLYEREYYLDMRGALTNHGSILFGNLIAQGVLFGKPELLREGIDALYAFIDSTVNRDGDYMELAGGYGRLGRDYGSRLVALLQYYDPQKYENAVEMPKRESYPYNLRVADDPRWYQTVVKMLYRMTVAGRYPQYGDVTPDRGVQIAHNNPWLDTQRYLYLRLFREQTSRADWKKEISELYYSDEPEALKSPLIVEDYLLYGKSQWKQLPRPEGEITIKDGQETELMGGKNVAILRSGDRMNRRALFMRGGANGAHGHDDQMAIVPYGNGMVLTGVYGYALSETPDHLSWGTRAIAHLAPTVNEDLPNSYLYKGFGSSYNTRNKITSIPPASVVGFGRTEPAQFVEMRNPALWRHVRGSAPVTDYRRTAWMIDAGPRDYYFVDIFRISGGRTHDYAWNSMFVGRDESTFRVEDIELAPIPKVWTLAALSGKYRDREWNAPGKSWGERLDGAAGRVLALPGRKEEGDLVGQRKNPLEPGNGYGMIWDIEAAQTKQDWKAIWKLVDGKSFMRSWMVNYDGLTAVTGKSPTLQRRQNHHVMISRREGSGSPGAQSRFVNVVEVAEADQWLVQGVERLGGKAGESKQQPSSSDVALKLSLANGLTDYLLSRVEPGVLHDGALSFEGRVGFVRLDGSGKPVHLFMQESSKVAYGEVALECAEPLFTAKVVSVNAKPEGEILLDRPLPKGAALKGHALLLRGNPQAAVPVSHDEYYEIEEVDSVNGGQGASGLLRFRNQSLALARAEIESVNAGQGTLFMRWPSEVAGLKHVAYLDGRGITVEDGGAPLAQVKTFNRRELAATSLQGFKPGQQIKILAAQPGDTAAIPATISLTQESDGHYSLRSNTSVKVTLPVPKGQSLTVLAASGRMESHEPSKDGLVQVQLAVDWFDNGPLKMRIGKGE